MAGRTRSLSQPLYKGFDMERDNWGGFKAWSRLACLLLGLVCGPTATAEDNPGQHEADNEQRLERLLVEHPGDASLRADLVRELASNGRYEQAVETAARLDPDRMPAYVLVPWARSLRELGKPGLAAVLLDPPRRRAAAGREAEVLYALVLAEAGRHAEAEAAITALLDSHAGDTIIHNAAAYIYRRLGQPTRALRHAHEVLSTDPGNREARQHQVFALGDLSAAIRALELAENHPGAFDDPDRERLDGDRAAQLIRWDGTAQKPGSREYHRRVRTALGRLEARIARLPAGNARRRARFDRVLALRRNEDMLAAIDAFEALLADGLAPPPYVRIAAADAYLDQRRPRQAAILYRRALAAGGGGFETRVALYYALLESEDFEAALEHIDAVAKAEPSYWPIPGSEPLPNWDRLSADLAAAMARVYANRLEAAQRRLEGLLAAAPASAQIHRHLATVYRLRGWPNRAMNHAELAMAYEPDAADSRLARAEALAGVERFAEADQVLTALARERPLHARVERARDEWRQRRRWRIRVDAESGDSDSDGAGDFGTRDRRLETRIDAPWLAHFWRPYLTQHWSSARFPEGDAEYDRVGAGLDWRRARRHAYLEIHGNRTGETEAGITAGYDWHAGDRWSFATRYESFSLAVPLRARGAGLDGWRAEATTRWRSHESFSLRGSVSGLDISDGNTRLAGLLGVETRPVSTAHHITRVNADLYASRASQTGGPYFNPEHDASTDVTLEHDWLTWRRYDRSFTQRFSGGAGAYWQDGFGTHPTWFIRYAHRWELGTRFHFGYHAGLSSRVYDGEREHRRFAGLFVEALL